MSCVGTASLRISLSLLFNGSSSIRSPCSSLDPSPCPAPAPLLAPAPREAVRPSHWLHESWPGMNGRCSTGLAARMARCAACAARCAAPLPWCAAASCAAHLCQTVMGTVQHMSGCPPSHPWSTRSCSMSHRLRKPLQGTHLTTRGIEPAALTWVSEP